MTEERSFRLRRTWPDAETDYVVIGAAGEPCGRIYRSEAAPLGAGAWLWFVNGLDLAAGGDCSGRADSFEEAKAAWRRAYGPWRAAISDEVYEAAVARRLRFDERIAASARGAVMASEGDGRRRSPGPGTGPA